MAVTKAIIDSIGGGDPGKLFVYARYMDGATEVSNYGVEFDITGASVEQDIFTGATNAVNTYAGTQGWTLSSGIVFPYLSTSQINALIPPAIPMYVNGVAKTGYFAVVGSPSVAGGSGVARFYIDTNGDGTGTAPSEVYAASLQAVVVNSTASYLPQSVTVDTNRKYIDVKMGQLATGLAGIVPILTGAVSNAANGTVVNCFVLVKK